MEFEGAQTNAEASRAQCAPQKQPQVQEHVQAQLEHRHVQFELGRQPPPQQVQRLVHRK